MTQRPALGALFSLLAIAFAGVAFASGNGAGGEVGRWIIAFAAAGQIALANSNSMIKANDGFPRTYWKSLE